ncbi:MAG: VWA domain-containing protein [Anaerolineales bacterium]|jgi:Ca-activated chloride channel family protein
MAKETDYYALLGVTRNASQDEIKRAYLAAAQRLHPDKNKAIGETEIFLNVQQAYETLSNPDSRKKYDAALPKEEIPSLPFKHTIYYSRPNLVRMEEPQLLYILLEIAPQEESDEIPTPPLNVALVLDRSTSMKDEKMDVLKNAAIKVMQNLRSKDIFSVVTFSDRAEVLIPASYPYDKRKLESRIQMLQPSGGTEIYQGLLAAYNEIQRNIDQECIDHIILLTDGHTYGDDQECFDLAEQASKQGIGISAMGIGKEWNDEFLDTLAKRTGGSSRYIARTEDIQKFLVDKFESLARTLADDVILEIKQTPGAEMAYAFRTQPETGPLPIEGSIHLGPLLQDSTLNILFEYRIEGSMTSQDIIYLQRGRLKLSIATLPTPLQPLTIEFAREVKDEPGEEPPPAKIIQSLGKLTLYRMQEKAHMEVEQGQFELAAQHMKNLATSLLAQGERSLARTALIEAENITQMQSFSEEGSKEIKYGTRSLIMPLE